jgi:hypothetical protein
MNRRDSQVSQFRLDWHTARASNPKLPTEKRLRSGGAEQDEHARGCEFEFGLGHGLHAVCSLQLGLSWIRFGPRAFHLKCLTALVR